MTIENKKKIRGSGRVGFLAEAGRLKKMVDAGHPLLSIYQKYEKDMSIGYSQFVKYIHQFIRSKPREMSQQEKKPAGIKEKRPVRSKKADQPAFVSTPTQQETTLSIPSQKDE